MNLTLLKIISTITLITGVLLPTNITQAANSSQTNKASIKQEIPQLLLSKKARKIEFLAFVSIIGFTVVVPEIFYNPKKNNQSLKPIENQDEEGKQSNNIEQELDSLKVINEPTNPLSLVTENSEKFHNQEKIELKNQSEQKRKAA